MTSTRLSGVEWSGWSKQSTPPTLWRCAVGPTGPGAHNQTKGRGRNQNPLVASYSHAASHARQVLLLTSHATRVWHRGPDTNASIGRRNLAPHQLPAIARTATWLPLNDVWSHSSQSGGGSSAGTADREPPEPRDSGQGW